MVTKSSDSEFLNEDCSVKLSSMNSDADDNYNFNHLNDCEDGLVESNIQNEIVSNSLKDDDSLHILSGIYAEVLIVVAGVSIFSELLHGSVPLFYLHDYIFIFLLIIGIILLIGAYSIKFHYIFSQDHDEIEVQQSSQTWEKCLNDIHIFYKLGIMVFGSFAIIASFLEIVAIFIAPDRCMNFISSFHPVLRCVFILFQMGFIWHSREIIRIWGCIRNVAIMHLFATNVAIWIRFLFWESAKVWEDALHVKHNSSIYFNDFANITIHSLESDPESSNANQHYPTHVVHYASTCYWRKQNTNELDVTSVQYCLQNSTVGLFWERSSQLFYPFICQYYIIIAAVLYIVWVRLNDMHSECHYHISRINANFKERKCSRSTKGLFLGLNVLAIAIIVLIVFFSVHKDLNIMLRSIYCAIFISSSFASMLGFFQVKKLPTTKSNKDTKLVKLFQNMSLIAVFANGSCCLIFSSLSDDDFSFLVALEAVSMVIHGIVQYLFLVKAYKKRVDVSSINEKPGRQAVVYLLLSNISLFILDCFVSWNYIREYFKLTSKYAVWPIIIRFIIPIVVFNRFHAFSAFYYVWEKTYT